MASKYEITKAEGGGCLLCARNSRDLYVVRAIEDHKLAALCGCCLLQHLDRYMIDNTRPWPVCELK